MSQTNSMMMEYLNRLTAKGDQANAANESRYQDILALMGGQRKQVKQGLDRSVNTQKQAVGEVRSGFGAARGQLETAGQSERSDITRRELSGQAGNTQSLIGRGLFNSTVLDAMNRRTAEEGNRARADVTERIAGQRAGLEERGGVALGAAKSGLAEARGNRAMAMGGLTGEQAGFMERRSDVGPDYSAILPMLSQFGQAQGAQQGQQSSAGKSYSFAGVNPTRFSTGAGGMGSMGGGGTDPMAALMAGMMAGGMGGMGGAGGGGGSGVQSFTNPGGAMGGAGAGGMPSHVWKMNPLFKVVGNTVQNKKTGQSYKKGA